ncbi:MAG: prepilin peptidase [Phycisphaerae bacterium]|jgi:leader peptidase (prepilin peptidase)/N-methyltransferase
MDAAWLIFLVAIGACVGSFLNVVIHRLPRGMSIVFPPSHCPACGRLIHWHDNIPLVSWLVLRGRCRRCKAWISPRYLVVEAAAACLAGGLYAWYYLLHRRAGAGDFAVTWPTYLAHVVLLWGLLACAAMDIGQWIVPVEVCWVVSAVGIVMAGAGPHPLLPAVSPTAGAMSLAAAIGLGLAMLLRYYDWIPRSFGDADDAVQFMSSPLRGGRARAQRTIIAVAVTGAHGVDPRKEILLEVLFLAPALVLAAAACVLMIRYPAVRQAWAAAVSPSSGGLAVHVNGLLSALCGFLVGGLWVWGARILGTLAFGKEAMGRGDVDILASVGAATGWIVPSVVFFLAPFLGLLWVLLLRLRRRQRELPYGPWLAVATLIVILFYDNFARFILPYFGIGR